MPEVTARIITRDDFKWPWRTGAPQYQCGKYGVQAECDPFPSYAHDVDVVRQTAADVTECWAPGTDVVYLLSELEEIGRSNGFACRGDEHRTYDEDHTLTSFTYNAYIWFSGKRIPPHPAMTRYLVAHEYGHHVEWWIEHQRGLHVDGGEVMREYMALRGIDVDEWDSGGRWHASATEVFANDFRILVCDIEAEYWPHAGISHPNTFGPNSDVRKWWEAAHQFEGELNQNQEVSDE